MKGSEMFLYCIIYPILTIIFFAIWYFQTPLTGESIGLAPILLAMVLFLAFVMEIVLLLIFRKKIISLQSKAISFLVVFLLYEGTLWFFKGDVALIEAFQEPFPGNLEMAFSFSSLFALLIIFSFMLLTHGINAENPSEVNK